MLTGKQRARLRALAATEDTILIIGKGGITPNVTTQAADALRKRELMKGRVLESSLLTAREACETLAQRCRAESVSCIGSRFVLYKRNETAQRHVLDGETRKGAVRPALPKASSGGRGFGKNRPGKGTAWNPGNGRSRQSAWRNDRDRGRQGNGRA